MSTTFGLDDLLAAICAARGQFMKHLEGVKPEQLTWKPYPECKSIIETLQHLVIVDISGRDALLSGKEPDYESYSVPETDFEALKARLSQSHEELVATMKDVCAGKGLDETICIFGYPMKIGVGITGFACEDHYHAGQVAFIRMATDPTWNYYAAVYGMG